MNQFLNDLEDGKFDPSVSSVDGEIEPTSPTSVKENDGSPAENGSTGKDENAKEDEFGMGLDGDEEAGALCKLRQRGVTVCAKVEQV